MTFNTLKWASCVLWPFTSCIAVTVSVIVSVTLKCDGFILHTCSKMSSCPFLLSVYCVTQKTPYSFEHLSEKVGFYSLLSSSLERVFSLSSFPIVCSTLLFMMSDVFTDGMHFIPNYTPEEVFFPQSSYINTW